MPAVVVRCPHCSRTYCVDGSKVGRNGRCKHCGNSFALAPTGELASLASTAGDESVPTPSPSSWSAAAPLPEKIGRFLVKQCLGAGACGAVYRALDPTLDRDVALKVPHPEYQQDPKAIERFLREAKAAAKLQHPHIVPVYETGTDGDSSYIASAFIPGRSLADAIDDGPFEPRRAARIVAALADALHAAHQQGIVHRDVKPANVLLDSDDRPHLTDFGLARLAAAGAKLTKVGSILGTPAYLAPEQARGKSGEAEPASDQYSLGVTLYELLCGHVPFAGPLEVVIFNTLQTPPPPLRDEHPEIPAELEAICLKALSKKPDERHVNCRELAKDLGRWLAGRATSPEIPVTSPITEVERAQPTTTRGLTAEGSSALPRPVVDEQRRGQSRPAPPEGHTGWGNRRIPRRWAVGAGAAAVPLVLLGVVLFIRAYHGTVRRERAPSPQVELVPEKVETPSSPVGETPNATEGFDGALGKGRNPVRNAGLPTDKAKNSSQSIVETAPSNRVGDSATNAKAPAAIIAASPKLSPGAPHHELMAEVERALVAKDAARASRALVLCPADLRGWEWHYCQQICELNTKNGVAAGPSPGKNSPEFVSEKALTSARLSGLQKYVTHSPSRVRTRVQPRLLSNIAFSPDGVHFAATDGSPGGSLLLGDASTAKVLKEERVCDQATRGLAYSPDGKRIATGSVDATVRIWDAASLELTGSRRLHASRVVSGWHRGAGGDAVRWGFKADGGIESVAFSPDGRFIASAGDDGTVRIWDFEDDSEERGDSAPGGRGPTAGPDPAKLTRQPTAKADTRTIRSKVRTLFPEHSDPVCDVVWDPAGRWIVSGGASKIKLWDTKTYQVLSTIDFLPRCLALSPDGRRIAAAGMDPSPTARVWDVQTRQLVLTLEGKKAIAFLDFSPDGKRLVTAGRWNVQIWDAATGHQLLELGEPRNDDPNDKVFSMGVRFSPDGRRIASVRGDLLRIWSVAAAALPSTSGLVAASAGKPPPAAQTKPSNNPKAKN